MTLEELRKHQAQLLRMLEDAAAVESQPSMYMIIGKLNILQQQIEELENSREWGNENDAF
ncbi:hypothetical protein NX029_26330 [Cytobacillus firmus]|nr:hypothetical protein [Cytobacillus firmus]